MCLLLPVDVHPRKSSAEAHVMSEMAEILRTASNAHLYPS